MTRVPTRRLADVARKVGVSEATVSRVLNGKAGVSDSTREAVLTALDVLGYERPTQLRGERARLVGLVLPELQNPIFPALAEVVGGALAQRGFTPVLCTRTAGGLSEADYVDMLLDQHVSGMVFFGGHCAEADAPHEHYRQLRSRGVPVGAAQRGHRRPGLPGRVDRRRDRRRPGLRPPALARPPADRPAARARATTCPRAASWPAFTERAGWPRVTMEHRRPSSTRCSPWRVARPPPAGCCARGVTGVICGSDVLALGAIRAVRRAGLSVPGDVSVVGYDDSAFMNCTDPPLTTVRQPIESMGQAAVALLVNQIEEAWPISGGTALRTRTRRPRLNGAPRHGVGGWRFTSLLHAIRTSVGVSDLQDASPRPSGGLTTVRICGMCNFCGPAQAGAMHDGS